MRKAALVSILLLVVSASIGLVAFYMVEANFVPGIPFIRIVSPANKTYNTNLIPLNFTISTFFDFGRSPRIVEYSLDGKENVTISTEYQGLDENYFSTVTGFTQLPELSEGSHTITVYATYRFPDYGEYATSDSKTVTFTIDLASPYVTVLSPENYAEYNTTGVPLIFTVDKPFSSLSYRLDGAADIPIDGNTTLTGLPVGFHKLVVYATNAQGVTGISETISFEILEEPIASSPSPSPTPTSSPETTSMITPSINPTPTSSSESPPATIAIFAFAVSAVACLGLLVSLKKLAKNWKLL
ncbi:MAG: hypothetical protein NWF09_07980 [Candidatus Bathyarchaeota archaeon]|nr:hypothetical protein [Candidatus Bathyarchaeota archaeon]